MSQFVGNSHKKILWFILYSIHSYTCTENEIGIFEVWQKRKRKILDWFIIGSYI